MGEIRYCPVGEERESGDRMGIIKHFKDFDEDRTIRWRGFGRPDKFTEESKGNKMDKYQIAIYRDMPSGKETTVKVMIEGEKVLVIRYFGIVIEDKLRVLEVLYRGIRVEAIETRIKLDQRSMRHYREHFDVVDMRDGLPSRYVGEGRRKEDIIELKGV